MLTAEKKMGTAKELQENYRRLNMDKDIILSDLKISESDLKRVLTMDRPDPSYVWMVRDYLEDKLIAKGIEVYPFSRLAYHSANKWFYYDTPWRKNKS